MQTTPRLMAGFFMKGIAMKKYITMDFDDKGKPVLGGAKDRPTQGFAFVPSGWVPTPEPPIEDGSGLKSISISPAITTTPALESMFPIEWACGIVDANATVQGTVADGEYTLTIEPTANMCVRYYDEAAEDYKFGAPGQTITQKATASGGYLYLSILACKDPTKAEEEYISVNATVQPDEPGAIYPAKDGQSVMMAVSPNITTVPAFSDAFPVYWCGVGSLGHNMVFTTNDTIEDATEIAFTFTPSDNAIMAFEDYETLPAPGTPLTATPLWDAGAGSVGTTVLMLDANENILDAISVTIKN